MKGSLKLGLVVVSMLTCALSAAGCRTRGRLTAGTELVLQVQLQDAFIAIADSAISQIKEDIRKNSIRLSEDAITRTEPKTVEEADKVQIDIKGLTPPQASDIRRIVTSPLYVQWTLTSTTSFDYRLNLTAAAATEIRRNTMDATIKTIEKKINALGSTAWIEPKVRNPNDAELLVQFPPTDDPARVVEVLRTKGILEWDQVVEGPFSHRDEALAKHGGVLPLDSKVVPEAPRGGADRRYWIVSSIPIVRSSDIVSASANIGETRSWETDFVLSEKAADRFEAYTSANIGKQAAIVVDGQALSVPMIQSVIRERGRITGGATKQEAADLALNLNAPMLAGVVVLEERRIGANPERKTK